MGIDERRVRAKFIQLLRQRTPDHPWVKTHDRDVAEHVAAEPESITDLIERVCCDKCPMGLSCSTQSWCYLESKEIG